LTKYILELTEEQAVVAMDACEILSRLHLGQYWIITDKMLSWDDKDYADKKAVANTVLSGAGMVLNGIRTYSEPKGHKNETCNRAWCIYEAIRYAKSWHEHPEGGYGVNFDPPINTLTAGEPLPTCQISDE
jgi:hypothetical protein